MMMKTCLVVLVALCLFSKCSAKPAEATATAGTSTVEELANNAKDLATKLSQQLGIDNLDTKKIGEALNKNTESFLNNLQTLIDHVKKEASEHEGEVKSTIEKVQTKLAQSVTELKTAAGPDASKRADDIKASFDKAYKNAADQVQQLVKINEPELKNAQNKLQEYSKSFLDKFLEMGKTLETEVKKAVEDHEKTHKN